LKIRMRKGTLITLILLGVGIVGGVLFFPINFNNQYTCLYHRMFAPEHRHRLSNQMMSGSSSIGKPQNEINEMLVTKYILPFGLIWWISLTIFALAFFWLRHETVKRESQKATKVK